MVDEKREYEYIKAVIKEDGISLRYQVLDCIVSGSDFIGDDNIGSWSDADVINTTGLYLGLNEADKTAIEVERW